MTDIENKLRRAGVDVDASRLAEAAFDALRNHKGNENAALRSLEQTVFAYPELIVPLVSREFIVSRLGMYLRARVSDMRGSELGAASLVNVESRPRADRRTPALSEPESGAASLVDVESRRSADRRPAHLPTTKISKVAAIKHAASEVFDEHVVSGFDFRWGDITQRDFMNLRIKNAFSTALEKQLECVPWPDMDTPLREFVSASRVASMRDLANAARDAALAATKRVTYAG